MSLAAEIVADSPSGYWKLDEAAGATSFADSSGNGHPLSIPGSGVTPGYAAGICSAGTDDGHTYARFNGGWASAASVPFPCNGAFTIEAWFKLLAPGATFPGIATYGPDANENEGWLLFLTKSDDTHHSLGFKRNHVQGPNSSYGSVEAKPGCVRQWAIDYDGTTTRGYLDGVEYGSLSVTYPAAATKNLVVGANAEGFQTADMLIAHFAIWSGTRIGPSRIAAHWNAGACPGCMEGGWGVGMVRMGST